MKKLLAIIGLIFTIGLMVDFKMEEAPPNLTLPETTLVSDSVHSQNALTPNRIQAIGIQVNQTHLFEAFADSMTFTINKGKIIPYTTKEERNKLARLDKKFDPGSSELV